MQYLSYIHMYVILFDSVYVHTYRCEYVHIVWTRLEGSQPSTAGINQE
jgi:hypothetical protein